MTLKSQRGTLPMAILGTGSHHPPIQEPGTETLATQGALKHSMQRMEDSFHFWPFGHDAMVLPGQLKA